MPAISVPRRAGVRRPSGPFSLNVGSPQARGLVGMWAANGGLLQSMARPYASPVLALPAMFGDARAGSGAFFDGTTNEGQVEIPTSVFAGDFTVSLWARFKTGSVQFGRALEFGANTGWVINVNDVAAGTNQVTFQVLNAYVATTPTAWADNTLHHFLCRRVVGSTTSIVVDGWESTSVADDGSIINTPTTLYFGRYGGGGFKAICTLFDIRMYSRALSNAEAWSLYANPWDIYRIPGRRVFFDIASAAAPDTSAVVSNFNRNKLRPRIFAPGLAR